MQFYDLYRELISYIPDSFQVTKDLFEYLLPLILMVCSLLTAFFGLKCAKIWASLTFFFFGVTVCAGYILPEFNMYSEKYYIMLEICIAVGILCAYFTKYLSRIQISAAMFMMVYAALPSLFFFFGELPAKIISAIAALALAFLSVKYMYIITIATTAFSGAFIFFGVLGEYLEIKYRLVYSALLGFAALVFQAYDNRETLKKTYKDVKKKVKKTKEGSEKAVSKLKQKKSETGKDKTEETPQAFDEAADKEQQEELKQPLENADNEQINAENGAE